MFASSDWSFFLVFFWLLPFAFVCIHMEVGSISTRQVGTLLGTGVRLEVANSHGHRCDGDIRTVGVLYSGACRFIAISS